jgi:2-keto-4-pentenoate hydratase/2-oxohepta-3-ene-1,7-dioic acid hydratase in catechol pathway
MKLARFLHNGEEGFGAVQGDYCQVAAGELFKAFHLTKQRYPLDQIKLLPPTRPSKIVALGLNYRDHAEEVKSGLPDEPPPLFKTGLCRYRPVRYYHLPCHVKARGL